MRAARALLDWLADGSLLVSLRAGDTAQLHRVGQATGRRPSSSRAMSNPSPAPAAHPYDANLVVYRKDRGGDENTQLWLRDVARWHGASC